MWATMKEKGIKEPPELNLFAKGGEHLDLPFFDTIPIAFASLRMYNFAPGNAKEKDIHFPINFCKELSSIAQL